MQVQAAALQRVAQVAHVVGGQDHDRRHLRLDRADLRDRDLVVGQDFQQERLELLVRLVDLVDQQHGAAVAAAAPAAAGAAPGSAREKNRSLEAGQLARRASSSVSAPPSSSPILSFRIWV